MMKRLGLVSLALMMQTGAVLAQMKPPALPGTPSVPVPVSEVNIEGVTVSQLAVAIFRDVEKVPFVLSPEVYADTRALAVDIKAEGNLFHQAVVNYFTALGYKVERRAGVLAVAPLDPVKEEKPEPKHRRNGLYHPKYRDVSYLVDTLRPLFPEVRFGADRGVTRDSAAGAGLTSLAAGPSGQIAPSQDQLASASPASALGQVDREADVLVYNGVDSDVEAIRDLLPQLDLAQGQVIVRATVYEVSTDKTAGSAVALAASLLGAKLGVFLNSQTSGFQDALTVKVSSLSAVVSALDNDTRFKTLSSPVVRARSGSQAVFQSGQEVPVLGGLSYVGTTGTSSAPVQSVQYRSAGVIFKVKPVVRESEISLDIDQELSDFVATTTGVNSTPTLNKRSMSSSLSVQPGDVVLLGGLVEDKLTKSAQGLSFLPAFLDAKNDEDSRSEIMLVLQVLPVVGASSNAELSGGHIPVPEDRHVDQ